MDDRGWEIARQRARVLAEEAESMSRAGCPIGPGWLESAASWLATVAPPWEDMTGTSPLARSYRLLVSSLHVEAWLICWPPGGRLPLHDHGGAVGAFEVVHGALHETYLDAEWKPRDRKLGPGRCVAFGHDYVHDVVNLTGGASTSVHLYGAATRSMQFFRIPPRVGSGPN